MRKVFILFAALLCLQIAASAQNPEFEYIMEIKAVCDPSYTVGQTAHGERAIIPIVGGTFEGPRLKGTVIPGGADYQLIDKVKGRTELEAIYSIRTDDGVNIHVRNVGLSVMNKDGFYFRTAPKFEAPSDSRYDWLNNAIFVCVPEGKPDYISLKIYMVN